MKGENKVLNYVFDGEIVILTLNYYHGCSLFCVPNRVLSDYGVNTILSLISS